MVAIVILLHLVPVSADDEGQAEVHGIPANALQQVFLGLGFVLLCLGHAVAGPLVQGIADVIGWYESARLVQLVGPLADEFIAALILLGVLVVLHHFEIGVSDWHYSQSSAYR